MDYAERIQRVINTLGDLDIKSTPHNMDCLLGSMQELARIREGLKAGTDVKVEAVAEEAGEARA